MIQMVVDGRQIEADQGQSLLQVCLRSGIYIPHLCYMEDAHQPDASCRLCFVEIEGYSAPVASCTVSITEGLSARTDTDRVRHLQRSALRLLLSAHDVDCKHCHVNRACALQNMAGFLNIGLKPNPLEPIPWSLEVDHSHPCIDLYPHRCVLCGKCIRVCRDSTGKPLLALAGRGINTRIRHLPAPFDEPVDCRTCGRCISVCPVGALQLRISEAGSNPISR
jgi:bidirectional [NiFe] hydrogenase diaphorase subunit